PQLRRNGAAHERRFAQAQGFSRINWRIGRDGARIGRTLFADPTTPDQFRHTRPSARLRLVTRLFLRSVSAAASLQRAKLESQSCASTDLVGSATLDRS